MSFFNQGWNPREQRQQPQQRQMGGLWGQHRPQMDQQPQQQGFDGFRPQNPFQQQGIQPQQQSATSVMAPLGQKQPLEQPQGFQQPNFSMLQGMQQRLPSFFGNLGNFNRGGGRVMGQPQSFY